MADSTRTTRIHRVLGALLVAGVLIGGAYVFANPHFSLFHPIAANAESTQALLQAYAQKDSDNDGLPDWQETLYGTDPHNAHSVDPNLTDSQAVAQGLVKPRFTSEQLSSSASSTDADVPGNSPAPGSLTDEFSKNLMNQYLSQQGSGSVPTSAQLTSLAQNAIQDLIANHASSDRYSESDIHVKDSGADALKAYAAAVEAGMARTTIPTEKSEVDYFADAVEHNDPTSLDMVVKIGKAYTAMAADLATVQVPAEAQGTHLEIVNAMAHLGEDITDMGTMQTDPLRAYLGLAQYQNDAPLLVKAFKDLNEVFTTDGVQLESGSGSSVYRAAKRAALTSST